MKCRLLNFIAEFNNKKPEDLTACVLDRPRHKKIIDELKSLKVNLKLITDGDVSGALLVCDKKYNVDYFQKQQTRNWNPQRSHYRRRKGKGKEWKEREEENNRGNRMINFRSSSVIIDEGFSTIFNF